MTLTERRAVATAAAEAAAIGRPSIVSAAPLAPVSPWVTRATAAGPYHARPIGATLAGQLPAKDLGR